MELVKSCYNHIITPILQLGKLKLGKAKYLVEVTLKIE